MRFKSVSLQHLSPGEQLELLTRMNSADLKDGPWLATCETSGESRVVLSICLAFGFEFRPDVRSYLEKAARSFIERMTDVEIGRLTRYELEHGNRPELCQTRPAEFHVILTPTLANEAMDVLSNAINLDSVRQVTEDD